MIWVQILLDMDFFLLYMIYVQQRDFHNISLPAAHYNTDRVDRHACWKQDKTIN